MIDSYYKFALDLAKETAPLIKKNFSLSMKKQWMSDNSPVTATDLKINKLVITAIKKKFPDHGILGEEGSWHETTSDYVWVCDPVDGTIPFSHGVPTCVFMLSLVHKGKSLVGVVVDPFLERTVSAKVGGGAKLNNKPCRVSEQNKLKNALIGIGHWKAAPFDVRNMQASLSDLDVKQMNVGSIGYLAMLVACGECAGTVYAGNYPYETAALKVIIEEAGGRVTDLFGKDPRYDGPIDGHVASNGRLHDELLRLVRKSLSKKG